MSSVETATATPAKAPLAGVPPVEPPKTLKPTAFGGAEFCYATFSATLPEGHTIEDVLQPEYWVHVAGKLGKNTYTNEPDKTGAIIEIRTVDHAFYARLYVRAVQERGLIVQLIEGPVLLGQKQVTSAGYETSWNVGKRGFDIIRKSDRAIVADASKIKTKEQAQAWINAS